MSYRARLGKIKFAEERGVPLLITQVGGEMGGGAVDACCPGVGRSLSQVE